jgi:hypothetical protein
MPESKDSMSIAALIYVNLLLAQGPQTPAKPPDKPPVEPPAKQARYTAEDFDEEMIAGHPDGEPLAQPVEVNWSLDKAEIDSTPRRRRLTLAGKWRFAAQAAKDTETLRKQMGWLDMPAGVPSEWKLFDARLKPTKSWNGKPLASLGWAWAERELHAPVDWVKHQVFLVVKGPWSEAELFVGYFPIAGQKRDGGTWFEITENLVYGGDCPLALRLDLAKARTKGKKATEEAEPYIGLELLPTGPRFNNLRVRQDPDREELELDFDLRRPKFILGLPVRLPEIPLIVQFKLEDATSGEVVQRFDQNIGPMPEETRNVKLRVAWSKEGSPPPEQLRLRTRLTSVYGGNMDIPYPLEFAPRKLKRVADSAK